MKVGLLITLEKNIHEKMEQATKMGIHSCQLSCWDFDLLTEEFAQEIKDAMKKNNMEISALWAGWSGTRHWNFYEGPHTLGIVPMEYRQKRCAEIKRWADFAKMLNITDVITHVGFIPENPSTTEYISLVIALRDLAEYLKKNGQYFLFETGQETPVTLLRTIEEVCTGNLGINLDPANLILYGKANPVDALDVFGSYVRGIHGKDGVYPVDGKNLGKETRMGEGKVNYPAFIQKLKEIGYNGAITIEREISGEEQFKDIQHAKLLLENLI